MGFFDFLSTVDKSKYGPGIINRMNLRRQFIIEPFIDSIRGARVLDLASHDGRWCYAFAGAGAREVVGIEGRQALVAQFAAYPDTPFKARVRLRVGEIFAATEELNARSERFNVVAVLGIYYHIMDHFRLLRLIKRLAPKLIVIDSLFITDPRSVILVRLEDTTTLDLNAIEQFEGQRMAAIGVPSQTALENLATALEYSVQWLDWNTVPDTSRSGLEDYFRTDRERRFTCALWPQERD